MKSIAQSSKRKWLRIWKSSQQVTKMCSWRTITTKKSWSLRRKIFQTRWPYLKTKERITSTKVQIACGKKTNQKHRHKTWKAIILIVATLILLLTNTGKTKKLVKSTLLHLCSAITKFRSQLGSWWVLFPSLQMNTIRIFARTWWKTTRS